MNSNFYSNKGTFEDYADKEDLNITLNILRKHLEEIIDNPELLYNNEENIERIINKLIDPTLTHLINENSDLRDKCNDLEAKINDLQGMCLGQFDYINERLSNLGL